MFYFNNAAAIDRPGNSLIAANNLRSKLDGYKQACAQGKQLAEDMRPVLQAVYETRLAREAKKGEAQMADRLGKLRAQLLAMQAEG